MSQVPDQLTAVLVETVRGPMVELIDSATRRVVARMPPSGALALTADVISVVAAVRTGRRVRP
jgi:hypothetical protein